MPGDVPRCKECGVELTEDNWYKSRRKGNRRKCNMCRNMEGKEWRKNNPDKARAIWTRNNRRIGKLPLNERKDCGAYLGVHVAEHVLSNVFKNVERMPYGNVGFDFICSHRKKIEVKSACKTKRDGWVFNIRYNDIADFFLLLAFDNRKDLNPLNMWLIPSSKVSDKHSISFRDVEKNRWSAYRLEIDKVVACCDVMRT